MAATRTLDVVVDAAGAPKALRVPAFSLRVVKGPDLRLERRFATDRVLIGSSAGAQFPLTDPTVSAVHCEILADGEGVRVRDLGAKNGTLLGGRRVQQAWLDPKDDLALGGTVVRFRQLAEDEDQPLEQARGFGRLRGSSIGMRQLYAQLTRAAATDVTVLFQAETGCGKELAAEALVSEGPRRDKPLVVLDCGRLPPTLAESELFGHEKGSFTGATSDRAGAFERAQGGTLFIDEVGELPLELQPKLLGALERRSVQRLGGSRPIPVDVRVIAATHRELQLEVNRGTFRADLFYRLAVAQLRIPSLRERREDIPELIGHFLEQLPGSPSLPPGVFQRLCDADYPGNVRELRNAVERATLGFDQVPPPAPREAVNLDIPFRLQKERLVAGFERAYFARLLEAAGGNVSEAARRSGLSRVHVHQILRRWQLGGRST